jgi:DNA-3-methyladenine glycosylase
MSFLPPDFYERPVLVVARELIGCTLAHAGTAGVIVETEAYRQDEPACHAYAGLTPRTRTLFGPAGRAYVYRSYGVHALVNAVCEEEGVGAGVLIRALAPVSGIELMRARRALGRPPTDRRPATDPSPATDRRRRGDEELCSGPGKLTQALAIDLGENGSSLTDGPIRIAPAGGPWTRVPVVSGPRVGITRATDLPWRFCVVGDRNVSRPRPRPASDGVADAGAGAGADQVADGLADGRADGVADTSKGPTRARTRARAREAPLSRSG